MTDPNFDAEIEDCNLLNYENVPINFTGTNAQNDIYIDRCINSNFSIFATNVTDYSFKVFNIYGTLIYTTNGSNPTSNSISLWDVTGYADGFYVVKLNLKNCSDVLNETFDLIVNSSSCRLMAHVSDTTKKNFFNNTNDSLINHTINENTIKNNSKNSLETDNDLNLFPNPVNNNLTLILNQSNSDIESTITITEQTGKTLIKQNVKSINGINKYQLETHSLPAGVYYITLINDKNNFNKKFVILR